jgi:hypothetical protein
MRAGEGTSTSDERGHLAEGSCVPYVRRESEHVAAAVSLLLVAVALTAFLPITVSVFAYAFVEARHRRAWAGLASPTVRVGAGPYRVADVVPARLVRAPLLVRAAALACFYWSWFCMLAWVTVGLAASDRLPVESFVVLGVVVAVCVGRTGVRLLRRDPRAVATGRRVAIAAAAHATLVMLVGFLVGGGDWGAPAAVFGVVTLGVATLLAVALRDHAPLFVRLDDPDAAARPVPSWLARLLERRAQRRANFLASASHTSAGA